MSKRSPSDQSPIKIAFWFLLKLIIYAGFVVAYYFLVLLLLRDWLKQTFDDHRVIYASIVLPLIIGQAILLDFLTVGLRKLGSAKEKK
jgi:hypothetical protein